MNSVFFSIQLLPFHIIFFSVIVLGLIKLLSQNHLLEKLNHYLILFLFIFCTFGYILQFLVYFKTAELLNLSSVLLLSLIFTLIFAQFIKFYLQKIQFERKKPTNCSLIGRLGLVYCEKSSQHTVAKARVRDELGQLHEVEIEPILGEFELHSHVILLYKKNNRYIAKKVTQNV